MEIIKDIFMENQSMINNQFTVLMTGFLAAFISGYWHVLDDLFS